MGNHLLKRSNKWNNLGENIISALDFFWSVFLGITKIGVPQPKTISVPLESHHLDDNIDSS